MPVSAQRHHAKVATSSKKMIWVAKDRTLADANNSKTTAPGKSASGRQQRPAGVYQKGQTNYQGQGAWQADSQADKKQASNKLSIDEVQQGLTMLLHQFKSVSQDSQREDYAMPMQYLWPDELSQWTVESMQYAWGDLAYPWGSWGDVQTRPEAAPLLLHEVLSRSSPTPLSVVESDEGTSISEKIYGRGFLLRARRCLLCRPGNIAYDGPKWDVEARPLELKIQVQGEEPNVLGMPRSPPPAARPSLKLDPNAPSFEIAAPAWEASSEVPIATDDGSHLTPDMSMAGYTSAYADPESMAWQASAQSYFPTFDVNGMPLLLPEVPSWPFGSIEGQEVEDLESTAASSGQSRQHSPSALDAITEAKARLQVEYYLSAENLSRDAYLYSKMDKDGWVTLDVLACFPRMQQIGADVAGIAAALAGSMRLEVSQEPPLRVRGKQQ